MLPQSQPLGSSRYSECQWKYTYNITSGRKSARWSACIKHNYWITTVKPDGSPHTMVVWGLWQDGRFLFSTGSQSRKARNLAKNPRCIVCTEDAHEAVIVEGVAEIADVEARRKLIPAYQRKYDWDLSSMKDDMLSMKEPVFALRPKVVFALWEKYFQSKSTRWQFK